MKLINQQLLKQIWFQNGQQKLLVMAFILTKIEQLVF